MRAAAQQRNSETAFVGHRKFWDTVVFPLDFWRFGRGEGLGLGLGLVPSICTYRAPHRGVHPWKPPQYLIPVLSI